MKEIRLPWYVQFVILPLVVASLLFAGLATISVIRFGNVSRGFAFVGGSVLVPDKSMIELGKVPAGKTNEIVFQVRSVSGQPVTIIGGKAECSCVMSDAFPVKVSPLASVPIRVQFTPRQVDVNSRVVHRILLYLDTDSFPVVLSFGASIFAPARAKEKR
jgi:Protein of unknown function (DUF1573)